MRCLVSLSLLFLASCASVTAAPNFRGVSQDSQIADKNYELNAERTTAVGDSMMRVRNYSETRIERQMMEANESFDLSGGGFSIPFQSHERLLIFGERENNGTIYTVAVKSGVYGIQIGPDGAPAQSVINGLGADNIVMVWQFAPSSPTARFTRVTDLRYRRTATGLNYELVFNGIDGQAMHFQYREFSGDPLDIERPATFQDIAFPLSTSSIRLRGIWIEVAAVTAHEIRYTVRAERLQ